MKHRHIEVVILVNTDLRIVGTIPEHLKEAFEECMRDGLELTFPIYDTRLILTRANKKTILVPK